MTPADADHGAFLIQLKDRIAAARLSAARAVNRELVGLYWDLGMAILSKQQTRSTLATRGFHHPTCGCCVRWPPCTPLRTFSHKLCETVMRRRKRLDAVVAIWLARREAYLGYHSL